MAEFKMPSLGADMESGKLIEWMVKPGQSVRRGDIMAVVGTEKGDIEIEVFEDGVVDNLLVKSGTVVPVGATLAHIRVGGTVAGESRPLSADKAAVAVPTNGHRIRISPLARRLAEELGVDLTQVHGTGPHGAISRADVEAVAEGTPGETKPAADEPERLPKAAPVPTPGLKPERAAGDDFQASMRKAIAAAMARSNQDIPHYYLETRIDMGKALTWLESENLKRSIKDRVLPVVLMIRAVAKGLIGVPALNGYWRDGRLQPQEGIHVGFAIALRQGGLITPAIHHVDLQGMDELMASVRDLIMRTRAGRLRGSELTDATITLTSLGDMGVEKVFGVIYPPQVALVGFGKIGDEVWVTDGLLGIRPVVHATLAGDHRATDGRTGAQFLDMVKAFLEAPEQLWV